MSCPFAACPNSDDCPNLVYCLADHRVSSSRNVMLQKKVQLQEAEDNSRIVNGTAAGHDCKSGEELVKSAGGGVIRARGISNGSAEFGQSISAVNPLGSARAIADSMPRG